MCRYRFVTGLLVACALASPMGARAFHLPVERLTADSDADRNPVVSGQRVAWFRNLEVQLFDGAQIVSLAYDPPGYGLDLGISDSIVAWISCEYYDIGICWLAAPSLFAYDGVTITRISSPDQHPTDVDVDGDRIVWAADGEIYLTENGSTTPLTDQAGSLAPAASHPAIHGSRIAWSVGDQVVLHDGDQTDTIFDDEATTCCYHPDLQVSDEAVAWSHSFAGEDSEIYYFDGSNVLNVSGNDVYDWGPSLSGARVVWVASDGADFEIFEWNGEQVVALTHNDYFDTDPVAFGDNTAWIGFPDGDQSDGEVFFHDGSSGRQITFDDFHQVIGGASNGVVAWMGCPDAPEYARKRCYVDGHTPYPAYNDIFLAPEPGATSLGFLALTALATRRREFRWGRSNRRRRTPAPQPGRSHGRR